MGNQSRAENNDYGIPVVSLLGVDMSPCFKYYHARKFQKTASNIGRFCRDDTRTYKNLTYESLTARSSCIHKMTKCYLVYACV
jgi:hypothetical protein